LLRCKSAFIIANFIDSGRVGIGSRFLNFISCKSVSACRLLPSLQPAAHPISSAAKLSCSLLRLLLCTAYAFCLRAMCKFCLLACYCTAIFCPFPLVMPLLVPGFAANCQFTRFIAGPYLCKIPVILHCYFYSSLLIAAVDLSPASCNYR
jgi:hypothetical protein